jgi:hypothetical protein
MAALTPPPRIGKFAGGVEPMRPVRKPARKARKPAKPKPSALAFAPGLINR